MPGSSGVGLVDRAARALFAGVAVTVVFLTGVVAAMARLTGGVGSARSAGARINAAKQPNSKEWEYISGNASRQASLPIMRPVGSCFTIEKKADLAFAQLL